MAADEKQADAPEVPKEIKFAPSVAPALWKCVLLIAVAALWSPVSQLTLSPTHGSIPASLYHKALTINAVILTLPLELVFLAILPLSEKPYYLPIVAFSVPAIQQYLTPTANNLGPAGSALLIESLTYGLIVTLTLNITWQGFKPLIPTSTRDPVRTFAPIVAAGGLFLTIERIGGQVLPNLIGLHPLLSRAFLPVLLASSTAVLLPSKYLLYAAFPLFHTILLNPHTPLPIPITGLNATIAAEGYSLLARKDSITGYISVLQNNVEGFRVLRCDHSLLGGEWQFGVGKWPGGQGFTERRSIVGEPVYSVFVMLEAVRLIGNTDVHGQSHGKVKAPLVADDNANALVIGLGIGTTPAAFVAHGIETTVVEIDPVVYDFAREYFELPTNHTAFIQDASVFVRHAKGTYDYIIHDVFTGGAEPAELFTAEFIRGLSNILKPNGIIAINYAGDLLLPPAALTVRTILSVFPNCRLFREDAPQQSPTGDFTNMVFFCRKTKRPFSFKEPVERDFLGSMARQGALMPRYEVDISAFDLEGNEAGMPKLLESGNIGVLAKWQTDGAVGHWNVMRTVIPPKVWETW